MKKSSNNFRRLSLERYNLRIEELRDLDHDFVAAQQRMAAHGQPCDRAYILSVGKDYRAAIVEACNKYLGQAGIIPLSIKNEIKSKYFTLYDDTHQAVETLYSVYNNPKLELQKDEESTLLHIDVEGMRPTIEAESFDVYDADKLDGMVASIQKMLEGKRDFLAFCEKNNLPSPFAPGGLIARNEYGDGCQLLGDEFVRLIFQMPLSDNEESIRDWLCILYKIYIAKPEQK